MNQNTLQLSNLNIAIPEQVLLLLAGLPRREAAALTLFAPDPSVSYLISSVALEEINGRDAYLFNESVRLAAALIVRHTAAPADQLRKIAALIPLLMEVDSDSGD